MLKAVIGIDPGNQAGIAVVTVEAEPFLIWSRGARSGNEYEQLLIAMDRAEGYDCEIVNCIIEDQFIGKNARGSIKMAQLAGRWAGCAEHLGLQASYVLPRAWQSVLGRDKSKKGSIAHASTTFDIKEKMSEHRADAIGIAEHAALKIFKKGQK